MITWFDLYFRLEPMKKTRWLSINIVNKHILQIIFFIHLKNLRYLFSYISYCPIIINISPGIKKI